MTDPLDQLRRAAKSLKSAADVGDAQARARLRAYPPRDNGNLKHADYLHVIARENNFSSWPALKAAVEVYGLDRAAKIQRLKIALFQGQTGVVTRLLAQTPDLAQGQFGLLCALLDVRVRGCFRFGLTKPTMRSQSRTCWWPTARM